MKEEAEDILFADRSGATLARDPSAAQEKRAENCSCSCSACGAPTQQSLGRKAKTPMTRGRRAVCAISCALIALSTASILHNLGQTQAEKSVYVIDPDGDPSTVWLPADHKTPTLGAPHHKRPRRPPLVV
jgi:hypothetical protein